MEKLAKLLGSKGCGQLYKVQHPEKWANRDLMKFNNHKQKAPRLRKNAGWLLGNRYVNKEFVVQVGNKLSVRQPCALIVKKGIYIALCDWTTRMGIKSRGWSG